MKLWALTRREVLSYLNLPIAYVVISAFLITSAAFAFLFTPFFVVGQASLRPLFEFLPFIFTLFVPALTMRLLAEERRSGTLELLVSWPVHDGQIVVAKFAGALAVLALTLLLTLPYPLSVAALGPLDWGPVIGGYVGVLLMGAAYVAIGLLVSAWTASQIVAFVGAFLICFSFYIVGHTLPLLPDGWAAPIEAISFDRRFANIARGVIDSRDVVFFLSVTAVGLLLTVESLQVRRWR